MKIGSIETKPAVTGNTADRSKSAAAPGPISNAPEASAKVDLSPAASSAASSSSATGASGDGSFDTAKVERIAQAIRDGKFSVNAEAIADKLIVNAEELLGRKLSS